MSLPEKDSSELPQSSQLDVSDDASSETSYGSVSTLTNGNNETSRSNTPTLQSNRGRPLKSKNRNHNKRKRLSIKKSLGYSSSSKYSYTCMAREDHGQPIFGAQFHQNLAEDEPLILATVGSNRVSIYECTSDGSLKILMIFADPDSDENFYCCAWTDDCFGIPLLAAAGSRGIIRLFSPSKAECIKHFLGHGHAINDLTFHPKDANLLLSASKDHSLRLWNLKSDICVAIFGGVEGHRDEVLSADIDLSGSRIVSCGMDHSLKTWNLNKKEINDVINKSYTYHQSQDYSRPFPTLKQNFPDYTTRDVHRNYVDCAKWIGNFILSKSCENNIICWKGGKAFQKWDEININTVETTLIQRLEIKDCEIWFIRFSLDYGKKILALGNQCGKTYIYDLDMKEPNQIKTHVLAHPKCTSAIRQTALSRDGSVLICVCDDSTIWRWDLNTNTKIMKDDD